MRVALAVLVVAVVGVGAGARDAAAGPTKKVRVETDPPGATAYLGDIDGGIECHPTPCELEAPVGKLTPVIVRKDGYAPEIGNIDLRHGSGKAIKIALTSSGGTFLFDDPGLAGGMVNVDDVDKGKAPMHVAAESAGHHVVVTVKGRVVFDDIITLQAGQEYTIQPNKSEPAPRPPQPGKLKGDPALGAATGQSGASGASGDDDVGATIGEGGGATGTGTGTDGEVPDKVTKQVDVGGPHETWFDVSALVSVGFRQFRYDNPKNLAPTEDEGGQILIGPAVQIWPVRLLGFHHLRGLSLYAKIGFGVNHKAVVQAPNDTPTGASTYWGNIEVDLLHRWDIGDDGAIEVGGGFVRDQLEYNATTDMALAQVPVADYRSLRVGARGILKLGGVEPFLQAEGRIVLSEGTLATRFSSADVTGGAAALGADAMLGPVSLRVQGSLVYYGWSLSNDNATATQGTADGARDLVEVISIMLGFAY